MLLLDEKEFIKEVNDRIQFLFENIKVKISLKEIGFAKYEISLRWNFCFQLNNFNEIIKEPQEIVIDSLGLFTEESYIDYIEFMFKEKILKYMIYNLLGARFPYESIKQ